jgi:transcriptional regulator with XRE-family HTH domain
VRDPWKAQKEALGSFIRRQRQMANLSLRQLAELTSLSNPYLSQIERGLHQPSVRVLKALSEALNVSAETLLAQAGLLDPDRQDGQGTGVATPRTEDAIRADERLTDSQKTALIAVYRSMLPPDDTLPEAGTLAQDGTLAEPAPPAAGTLPAGGEDGPAR